MSIDSSKLWNGDAETGITIANGITLGDKYPSCLVCGGSHEDRTALLHKFIKNMTTDYAPSDLQLSLVCADDCGDYSRFKGIYSLGEAKWYPPRDADFFAHIGASTCLLSLIPHVRLFAETAYADDIDEVLQDVKQGMCNMQAKLSRRNYMRLSDARKDLKSQYKDPSVSWPEMRADWEWYKDKVLMQFGDVSRKIIIIDGIDTIMYHANPDERDTLQRQITSLLKLCRAMGYGFILAAGCTHNIQSDFLQCLNIRVVGCTDPDTSYKLLGSDEASSIASNEHKFIVSNGDLDNGTIAVDPNVYVGSAFDYYVDMNQYLGEFNQFHNMECCLA